jgi:hypothetical protein
MGNIEYSMGYLISTITILASAYLAYSGASAWPWFLAVGFFAFFTTTGAEIRKNDRG